MTWKDSFQQTVDFRQRQITNPHCLRAMQTCSCTAWTPSSKTIWSPRMASMCTLTQAPFMRWLYKVLFSPWWGHPQKQTSRLPPANPCLVWQVPAWLGLGQPLRPSRGVTSISYCNWRDAKGTIELMPVSGFRQRASQPQCTRDSL